MAVNGRPIVQSIDSGGIYPSPYSRKCFKAYIHHIAYNITPRKNFNRKH